MKFISFLGISAIILQGCQRAPARGLAADSMSTIAPPPMGATTYNDELKRELALFDDLVNNRIEQKEMSAVVKGLMDGDAALFDKNHKHAGLVQLYLTLPELVHPKETLTETRKLWLKAKLLFLKRRFVEASMLMSDVLKKEPKFLEARNWRARAIFFLGNPDLAISELNLIVKESPKDSEASLDALYLIGAIVYEANDLDKDRLLIGINAWKSYSNHPHCSSEMKSEIGQSLAELIKRGQGQPNQVALVDPFMPNLQFGKEKNEILEAFQQEKLLMVEELCKKYLKQHNDVDVMIIEARTLFKTGRLDEAVSLFDQITQKNPRYVVAFHYKGMAFMMKGNIEHAIESWQTALDLDSAYAKAHNLERRIAVAQGMVEPKKVESH